MASSFSESIHNLWDRITGLFRPQPTLNTLSRDQLMAEKLQLERSEQKIVQNLAKLEAEKTRLFEAAKQEPSQNMRLVMARQIRDVDQRAKSLQDTLTPLGKRISVLNELIAQQEMGRFGEGSSKLVDALRATDALTVRNMALDQATQDLYQDEKLSGMLETMNTAREAESAAQGKDPEVDAILAEIERSAAAEQAVAEKAVVAAPEATPSREAPEAERE